MQLVKLLKCNFFYYQFYFNAIHLKCYTKSDRTTKTTFIALLHSTHDLPRTAELPHTSDQLPDCKIYSFINYHWVKKTKPSGAQGRKLNKRRIKTGQRQRSCDVMNDYGQIN